VSYNAAPTEHHTPTIPGIAAALAVLLCCLTAPLAQAKASAGVRSAVQPAALRTAETSPKPSGSPGHWAEGICSYKEEMLFYNEGWSAGSDGTYNSGGEGNLDTCLVVGGGFTVRDEGRVNDEPGTGPFFVYRAPDGSLIAGGVMTMTLRSPEGDVYVASPLNNKEPANLISSCGGCALQKQTIELDRPEATNLYLGATCTAAPGKTVCSSEGVNAEAVLQSATILLHNEAKPTASGIAGTLLAEPASGTANLSLTAYDKNGPGVYRVVVDIDGAVVSDFTPNENESRCVPLGTYEKALVFESAQPCPQTTGVSTEVPTSGISNGQHELAVVVEDAAGNSSVVYEHAITIANQTMLPTLPVSTPSPATAPSSPATQTSSRGPANGTPASEQASLTASWAARAGQASASAHLASTYGQGHEVTGKLASGAGVPIAGAAIEVSETALSVGAGAHPLTVARTGTDGSFTAPLPSSLTSGTITFAYRSHLGDPSPAATALLTISMPAAITLNVTPRVTRQHHKITLSGRLSGPIPPGGKNVVIEAREHGGSWVEFTDPNTKPNGTFDASHRFKYAGPVLYEFRAVCKHEADFPFSEGKSSIVSIWER
jgi:hypothetical protein